MYQKFLRILEQFLIKKNKKIGSSSEQPTQQQKVSEEQKNEVISKGKVEKETKFQHLEDEAGLCSMDFDATVGKDNAGIGIWIRSPAFQPAKVLSNVRVCSYRLAFDCSNNEAEYEAFITDLKILKKLDAKRISIYGDSELVIKQVKGEYQAKHPQMRAYRCSVLDILRMFPEYTLTVVPQTQNIIVDSLATITSNLNIPTNSSNKFEIHVKHRPVVPDNLRYLQVFWDDNKINSP